jgi:hypothetical protein
VDVRPYTRLNGYLIYLANTIPNLNFVHGLIACSSIVPNKDPLECSKKNSRVLKGTLDFTHEFTNTEFRLFVYTNPIWVSNVHDRKSTSSYIFSLGSREITWVGENNSNLMRFRGDKWHCIIIAYHYMSLPS